MTSIETGTRVRTLVELRADDGSLIPEETSATVIGYQGELLVLSFDDERTATCERWEVR